MKKKHLLIILIFLFTAFHSVKAQSESRLPDIVVTLPSLSLSVEELFQVLRKQGVTLSYSSSYLTLSQKLYFKANRQKVSQLLNSFLGNDRIQYLSDKVLILPPASKTITGYVYDRENGEALIGAILYDSNKRVLGITNEYGYFHISAPWQTASLTSSYVGYFPDTLQLVPGKPANFLLKQHVVKLTETTVFPRNITEPLASAVIDMKQSEYIPTLLGGDDVINRFQDASGVSSQSFFQPLSVRTDKSDNNLVLLDGIPVYSYMHIFSLFSIFNSNAIQKATLYKGLYPSKYEGQTGAILDIRMKDGNKKNFAGSATIDMATISAMIEGPIVKDKASFMLSARRSWLDALSLFPLSDKAQLLFSSFDLYFKSNLRLSYKNQLYWSTYLGGDLFELASSDSQGSSFLRWNNFLAAFRWYHVFNDKLFVNTSISFSKYRSKTNPDEYKVKDRTVPGNSIGTFSLNSDFTGKWTDWLKMNFGYKLELSNFLTPIVYPTQIDIWQHQSQRISVYYEAETEINSKLNLRSGFNYVAYNYQSKFYQQFQPRIQIGYRLNATSSLYAGFSRMGQFYHQITAPLISSPFELRIPSSERIRPASSDLYEIGMKGNLTKTVSFAMALFHKYSSNLLAYRFTQDPSVNRIAPQPADRVIQGNSEGMGAEFELTYLSPKWKINLAYTYSNSREKFPSQNTNEYVLTQGDIPHQLKTSVYWNMNAKSSLYTRFFIHSGMLISYPVYSLPSVTSVVDQADDAMNYYYDSFSTKRLSAAYQWDLGYALTLQGFTRRSRVAIRAGINNLLGSNKVYSYSPSVESNKVYLTINSLANLIPYVGVAYNF